MQKTDKIWLDGKMVPWDAARVHVLTHTLHYGLGVFEGIRAYEGSGGTAIFRLKEHIERLFNSAHILMMTIPFTPDQVQAMRTKHGIYFAGSGRINIAGLTSGNIDQFIAAVADVTG